MTVGVVPTGAGLGAEISGVDLSQPLDDSTFAEVEAAFGYGQKSRSDRLGVCQI